MRFLNRWFGKKATRLDTTSKPESSLDDLGPPTKGILDLGTFDPLRKPFTAIPILSERQWRTVLSNLPSLKQQGFINVVLTEMAGKPFPLTALDTPPHSCSMTKTAESGCFVGQKEGVCLRASNVWRR
jgi:hypothetical protein